MRLPLLVLGLLALFPALAGAVPMGAVEAVQPAIDWAGQGFLDPVRLKTYALTIQGLVDDILEGKPAGGSGWDGRQAVAAATAAYLSSQTGREIELNAAEHYAD